MLTNDDIAQMHHLTFDRNPEQKKKHLFEVIDKLKQLQKTNTVSKVVVLTGSNLTADYVSCRLNFAGINAASIHKCKPPKENKRIKESFKSGTINVLVTDKTDIQLKISFAEYLINYDMFIPNILYFDEHDCQDVFHEI